MHDFDLTALANLIVRALDMQKNYESINSHYPSTRPSREDLTSTLELLEKIKLECCAHAFTNPTEMANHTLDEWNKLGKDYSMLASELRHLRQAVIDALGKRHFAMIYPDRVGIYKRGEFAMGEDVHREFTQAAEDIKEAANCLAAECNTAAVFHSMRVVEWGLRRLCAHVGVMRVRRSYRPKNQKYVAIEYAQWENMLAAVQTRIDKKIEGLGPGKRKQNLQEFYYPLMRDLKGFKDEFRNHVMHARAIYDRDKAISVFKHVRDFMFALTKLKKPKKKSIGRAAAAALGGTQIP